MLVNEYSLQDYGAFLVSRHAENVEMSSQMCLIG